MTGALLGVEWVGDWTKGSGIHRTKGHATKPKKGFLGG